MSKEQTALLWFHYHLNKLIQTKEWRSKDLHIQNIDELFMDALSMERQQLMDAFDDGVDACDLEVDELGIRMVSPDALGGMYYYTKKFEGDE